MDFEEITDDIYPHPGEWILYVPDNAFVLCGAYMGDKIKVLHKGRVIEDKVENFKKVKVKKKEQKQNFVSRCKACGS